MAKVDGSLGSLVQGVSQQPDRARNVGQCEEQINVVNDEVFGMSRRPATYFKAAVDRTNALVEGTRPMEFGQFSMQGTDRSYRMRLAKNAANDPQLWITSDTQTDAVLMTVADKAYLRTNILDRVYDKHIVIKELDGKVYVVNTTKHTAMLTTTPPETTVKSSIVYCRGGQYANGYTIVFQYGAVKHVIQYSTPNGSTAAHAEKAQSKYIMKQLLEIIRMPKSTTYYTGTLPNYAMLIDPNDTSAMTVAGRWAMSAGADAWIQAYFEVSMLGEHLIFKPKFPSADINISSNDDSGTALLVTVTDEAKEVGKLPTRAPVGQIVKIVGSNRSEDDYYLRWEVDDYPINTLVDEKGVWVECTAPGEQYQIDPETMPRELYYDGTYFRMRAVDWEDREAGNNQSNPPPKFIGDTIRDISDFQGRFVILHGTNVSMSTSDEYTTWFKKTAAAELDTDPFNLHSTATDGDSDLIYAVPFNRDLIIFGTNNAQFIISGRQTVTYETASIVVTSEFDIDLRTRPRQAGENILFLSWTGKFTHVHEMYLRGNQNSHARRTITDHVPRYMQGRGKVFAADDGSNTAVVVTEEEPTVAYVYEYLWLDGKRVQSAWSKWQYAGEIEQMWIDRGTLMTVFKSASGGHITTESPLYREDAAGLSFPIHMDCISTVTLNNATTFTAKVFTNSNPQDLRVIALTGGNNAGSVIGMPVKINIIGIHYIGPNAVNEVQIILDKPYTGNVMFGSIFKTRYVPTMPIIRDADGVAVSGAELSIAEFNATFDLTGPFNLIRECTYERPEDYWVKAYSGRVLGDPDFQLGSVPIDSGVIDFPFSDLTTTSKLAIECDTHLPMTLTEIEWNGNVKNRSRRITNGG